MSATMTEPDERSLRIRFALSVLGSIAVYAVVARYVAPVALEGSGVHEGGFRVADFMLETELVQAYWSGEIDSPYRPIDQARVLASLGSGGGVAAAFAMNPATLVLLAPFAAFAHLDFVAAYSGWVALSFGIFLFVLLEVYVRVPRGNVGLRFLLVGAALVVVASRVGLRSFGLADTAPLAVAGVMLVLLVQSSDGLHGRPWIRRGLLGAAYFLALWKIHYVGLVAALHFVLGRRTEAVRYGTAALLVAIGIPTVFDPHLLTEFFGQVFHYSGQGFSDELVRLGQTPEGGSGVTLRSTLGAIIGSEPARILSLMLLVGSGVGILALDFRAEEAHGATTGPAKATALHGGAVRAYLVISAFLVLMPYLGRYDDMFLVACVALVSLFGQGLKSYGTAVGALAAMVVATQLTAPGEGEPAHLILGAKVVALGGLLLLLGRGGDPLGKTIAPG